MAPARQAEHARSCGAVEVACSASNELCSWQGRRSTHDAHVKICTIVAIQPALAAILRRLSLLEESKRRVDKVNQQLEASNQELRESKEQLEDRITELQDGEKRLEGHITELCNAKKKLKDRISGMHTRALPLRLTCWP